MSQAARRRDDARSLPPPKKRWAPFQFGTPLQNVPCCYTPDYGSVPTFLVEAGEVIRENVSTEGLFRKSGDLRRQSIHKKQVERGGALVGMDVHDVTSLVKTFFRLLPIPLVPCLFHDPLLHSLQLPEEKRADAVQGLCFSLPAPHLSCLRFFMLLLAHIAENVDTNRMTPRNLAVVLTPSLIRLRSRSKLMNQEELRALPLQTALVEYLICHAQSIGAMTQEMHQQSLRLAETSIRKEKGKKSAKKSKGKSGRSAEESVQLAHAVLGLVADLHFRPNSCSSVSDSNIVDTPCLFQELLPKSWKKGKHKRHHMQGKTKDGKGQEMRGQDYAYSNNSSVLSKIPSLNAADPRDAICRPGGEGGTPRQGCLFACGTCVQQRIQPIMGAQMSLMYSRWKPQQNDLSYPPPTSDLLDSWSRAIPVIDPKDKRRSTLSSTSLDTFYDPSCETLNDPSRETIHSESSDDLQAMVESVSKSEHTSTRPPGDHVHIADERSTESRDVTSAVNLEVTNLKPNPGESRTVLTSSPLLLQTSPCMTNIPSPIISSPPVLLATGSPPGLTLPASLPVVFTTAQHMVLPLSPPVVLQESQYKVHAKSSTVVHQAAHFLASPLNKPEVPPTSTSEETETAADSDVAPGERPVEIATSEYVAVAASTPFPTSDLHMLSSPLELMESEVSSSLPNEGLPNCEEINHQDTASLMQDNTSTPAALQPDDTKTTETEDDAEEAVIVSSQSSVEMSSLSHDKVKTHQVLTDGRATSVSSRSQNSLKMPQDKLRTQWPSDKRGLYSRTSSSVTLNSEKSFRYSQQGSSHHSLVSDGIFHRHRQHVDAGAVEPHRGVHMSVYNDQHMGQLLPASRNDVCYGGREDSHGFCQSSNDFLSLRRLVQERTMTLNLEAVLSHEPHTRGGRVKKSLLHSERRNTLSDIRAPSFFTSSKLSHCSCPDCTCGEATTQGPVMEDVSPRRQYPRQRNYYKKRACEHGPSAQHFQGYFCDMSHQGHHHNSNLFLNRRKRISHSTDGRCTHHIDQYQQYEDRYGPVMEQESFDVSEPWHEQHIGQYHNGKITYHHEPVFGGAPFDFFYDQCEDAFVEDGYYDEEFVYKHAVQPDEYPHRRTWSPGKMLSKQHEASQTSVPHNHYYMDTRGQHTAWTRHNASSHTFSPDGTSQQYSRQQHHRHDDLADVREKRTKHMVQQFEGIRHYVSDLYDGQSNKIVLETVGDLVHPDACALCGLKDRCNELGTRHDQWQFSQCVGDGFMNEGNKAEEYLGEEQLIGSGQAVGDGEAKPEATLPADNDTRTGHLEECHLQHTAKTNQEIDHQGLDSPRHLENRLRGYEGDAEDDNDMADDANSLAALRRQLEMIHIGAPIIFSQHGSDRPAQHVQQDGCALSNATEQEKHSMWKDFPPNYFQRTVQNNYVGGVSNQLFPSALFQHPQDAMKAAQDCCLSDLSEISESSSCSHDTVIDNFNVNRKDSIESASLSSARQILYTPKSAFASSHPSSVQQEEHGTPTNYSNSSIQPTSLSRHVLGKNASSEAVVIRIHKVAHELYGPSRNYPMECPYLCSRHRRQLMSMQENYTTLTEDIVSNSESVESMLSIGNTEEFTNNALASESTSASDVNILSVLSHESILPKSLSHILLIIRDVRAETHCDNTVVDKDENAQSDNDDCFEDQRIFLNAVTEEHEANDDHSITGQEADDYDTTEEQHPEAAYGSNGQEAEMAATDEEQERESFFAMKQLEEYSADGSTEQKDGCGSPRQKACFFEVDEKEQELKCSGVTTEHGPVKAANLPGQENDSIFDLLNMIPRKAFFLPDGDITFS